MLIHSEYTMHGHFLHLKHLFKNVDKVRFYMDQEAGIKNAFMAAFSDRVSDCTADGFYVSVTKELSNDEKEKRVAQYRKKIEWKAECKYSELTPEQLFEIEVELYREAFLNPIKIGKSKDQWILSPVATKAEPEKLIHMLTQREGEKAYDDDHLINLFRKGSLHSVDRFFSNVRNSVQLFDRPSHSGANGRRTWYKYNAYRPDILVKVAAIYRFVYNYVELTKTGETRAMRLGLAKAPLKYESLIYSGKYE